MSQLSAVLVATITSVTQMLSSLLYGITDNRPYRMLPHDLSLALDVHSTSDLFCSHYTGYQSSNRIDVLHQGILLKYFPNTFLTHG